MRTNSALPCLTQAADPSGIDFQSQISCLKRSFLDIWEGCTTDVPRLSRIYSPHSQRQNERTADQLIGYLEEQFKSCPESPLERTDWRRSILEHTRQVITGQLGFPSDHFQIITSENYIEVTRGFLRQAKAFDPSIEISSAGQALRNVWIMNCIQLLAGGRPNLTPSIFAYSMLYPYTDNYLDRAELDRARKYEFNRKLGLRLSGCLILGGDKLERDVYRLIGMIEADYSRHEYPEVFESLLAIHRGQGRSLAQHGCVLDPATILDISAEKGGSSVLADGYLVSGRLSYRQAKFCFGFGFLLQLLDDLQDLSDDLEAGNRTIFSGSVGTVPIDLPVSRLYHFMDQILELAGCYTSPVAVPLRDLIRNNCFSLMLQAIAGNSRFFTKGYVHQMQQFSPVCFEFIREKRRKSGKILKRGVRSLSKRGVPLNLFDLME